MREKAIEEEIKKFVNSQPPSFCTKIHADGLQGRNTLDLFGCYLGHTFYIDVKTPDGVVSEMQKYWIERARRVGWVTGAVTSLEEFKELFNGRK